MNDKAVLRNHIITFTMETKLFWYPHKSTENSKFVVIHSFKYKIYYEIWLKGMSTLFFGTLPKTPCKLNRGFHWSPVTVQNTLPMKIIFPSVIQLLMTHIVLVEKIKIICWLNFSFLETKRNQIDV